MYFCTPAPGLDGAVSLQTHPLSHAGALLDGRGAAGIGATLPWPTAALVTANFCNAVTVSGLRGSNADYIRMPSFLLICLDGSALLLSEREAHFVLAAMHDARRAVAAAPAQAPAMRTAVVHLAFARAALPRMSGDAQFVLGAGATLACMSSAHALSASLCVVGAQLFAGDTAYQRVPGSLLARDEKRMKMLRHLLLGGAFGVHGIGVRAGAVQELLACRKRGKHYLDSCLDDVFRAGTAAARAEQLQAGQGSAECQMQ